VCWHDGCCVLCAACVLLCAWLGGHGAGEAATNAGVATRCVGANAALRRQGTMAFATTALFLCLLALDNAPSAVAAAAAAQFPPLPAQPSSPSCMINGRGCPVPAGWHTEWALINSTALMSADPAGFNTTRRWGLVTLDWQSRWHSWIRPDPSQIHVEAASASACRRLKAAGRVRFCSIYHNMELALEWLESQRRVMDAAHVAAGWFLRFPNGSVINHARQVRAGQGPFLRQYQLGVS
jgi:hypothetical protein